MKLTTLCYIERENAYLMLHRVSKEHDVNRDKWIGVGGHFEAGESPEECVLREVKEETGLTLISWQFRGVITFSSQGWEDEFICLFTADKFEGDVTVCDEGVLEWVDKEKVLGLNLWEGDKIFFRLLNEKRPFFSLKLSYRGNRLIYAALDGRELELFDVRDSEGNVTGVARERALVHLNGDPHGTAHIWVVRKNSSGGWDVLLQKRSQSKDSNPGCYDISSAGHIQAGDDFLPAALRELKEELSIQARPEQLEFIGYHRGYREAVFNGNMFKDNEISAIYIYREPIDIRKLDLQEEELESVMWMDLEVCRRAVREGTLFNCIYPDELEMLSDKLIHRK
ncbi:MAG: NUDIX domain-containing protein [Clostridium sp.]|nr:NUDIX domain-containing protein [Clostridium sp.]